MSTRWPLVSVAAPLLQADIDTDVIMPKQYLKGIDRRGLADGLFHPLRYRIDGTPDTDFVLNRQPGCNARILLTGANFGCGSSREHAVWGMVQHGIDVIIGTSFGGIFRDNAINNGILAISLPDDDFNDIAACVTTEPNLLLQVDVENRTIKFTDRTIQFKLAETRQQQLLCDLDSIQHSLSFESAIRCFEREHWKNSPWLDVRHVKVEPT